MVFWHNAPKQSRRLIANRGLVPGDDGYVYLFDSLAEARSWDFDNSDVWAVEIPDEEALERDPHPDASDGMFRTPRSIRAGDVVLAHQFLRRNPDEDQRRMEREARGSGEGDVRAWARVLADRMRRGVVTRQRVIAAARLGSEAAGIVAGVKVTTRRRPSLKTLDLLTPVGERDLFESEVRIRAKEAFIVGVESGTEDVFIDEEDVEWGSGDHLMNRLMAEDWIPVMYLFVPAQTHDEVAVYVQGPRVWVVDADSRSESGITAVDATEAMGDWMNKRLVAYLLKEV